MLPKHMKRPPSLIQQLLHPPKIAIAKQEELDLGPKCKPAGKEKLCPGCLEIKPFGEFYLDSSTGKPASRCKPCAKEVSKAAYAAKLARRK